MNIDSYKKARYAKTLSFLKRIIPEGSKVLDLGTPNPLSELIKQHGYEVYNTQGEDLDVDYRFVNDTLVDVVTSFEVSEHLLAPFNILREIYAPRSLLFTCLLLALSLSSWAQRKKTNAPPKQQEQTYAEKLGWGKGDRVVILHIDDAGMSYDSNLGTIRALEEGVANSVSVMMPCPWVPGFVRYLKEHPHVDAGLHLTLTSEWRDYRWGPLVGKPAAPGLVDAEGALWPGVGQVTTHATADEVEQEIRAQLERARAMGFEPTHLDSHMGTLFATQEFLARYLKVGVEQQIPVMFPGGHNYFLKEQYREAAKAQLVREGKYTEGMDIPLPANLSTTRAIGQQIWEGGLPVLDDLHNASYGWKLPASVAPTAENLRKMKTEKYIEALRQMKPGVTMVIMHCTDPTEVFQQISDSGPTRQGDLLAMLDPALREAIRQERIILTTWRELKARRDKAVAPKP